MVSLKELALAEELLQKVASWSEAEVQNLPEFYRRKAVEYRAIAEECGLTEDR